MKIAFIVKQLTLSEPLGIMSLSPILKNAGHQAELFVVGKNQEEVMEKINNFKPDIVAYSIMTGTHRYYLDFNRQLKKKLNNLKFLSVFGGPHATFSPGMINEEGVDAICRGEGDIAFPDFIERLTKNEHYHTPNWWIKSGEEIIKNEPRPLINNLDDLPFIDRKMVYDKSEFLKNRKVKTFLSSRGCPFDCTYCFNHAYKKLYQNLGQMVRKRSVDNLLTEIKNIKCDYPVEMVWFSEDLFAMDKNWLREFAQKYKSEINLLFCCTVRLNIVDEEMVSLLKQAGCVSVMTGIESANDHMRNNVLNRHISKEQMENSLQLLKKYGLAIDSSNIIGLPGETLDDMLATLSFNKKI